MFTSKTVLISLNRTVICISMIECKPGFPKVGDIAPLGAIVLAKGVKTSTK